MKSVFKKQFFPDTTIQSLSTNQTVYNRGIKLSEDSDIKITHLNQEANDITFNVKDKNIDYTTHLIFYPNGVARKYQCTCAPFKKYSGACKHVVACMRYLNNISQDDLNNPSTEEINETPKAKASQPKQSLGFTSPSSRKTNEILEKLKENTGTGYNSIISNSEKETVKFEFVLNVSGSRTTQVFEFYMKIGLDHLYVVKNIPHVILNLLEGNEYEFGKNFIFNSEDYRIADEDRDVLETIYNIYSLARSINQLSYDMSFANKSEFEIPAQFFKEVTDAVSKTDGGFIRFGRPPQHLSKIDGLEKIDIEKQFDQIPVYFKLTKEGTRYNFQIQNYSTYENPLTFYKGADIIQYNHVLYFVSSSEYRSIQSIFETLKDIQYQPISLKGYELTEFISEIFPLFSSLFKIDIDEDVKKLVTNEEIEPKLYLDYQEDNLLIQLMFKYGDQNVYPFRENPVEGGQEKILIRKPEEEADLFNQLKEYLGRYSVQGDSLVLSDFDNISYFAFEGIEELSEIFDIYSTNEVRKLLYQPENSPRISMEINKKSNFLDISFETEEITEDDLKNIVLHLNKQDSSYYKLSNGQIVNLEQEEFQEIKKTTKKLDIDGDNIEENMSLPLYKGLSVLDDNYIQKGERFRELAKALLEPEDLNFEVPEELDATLRPYQETGFKWFRTLDYYQFGGVLADDMGLGKTIQTITFILSKMKEKDGKYLIICPSSVLYNWEFELNNFAPDIDTLIISGSLEERKELVLNNKDNKTEVWITSYPLIQRDSELYDEITFETVVLDESQNVKNAATKTAKAVLGIKSMNKFALSGTPIENNLNELWSLFSIIQPGLFNSKKAFNSMEEDQVAQMIKPFILRRLKGEVLDDLPPKTETTEYIDLSPNQKKLYQTQLDLIKKDVKEYIDEDKFNSNRIKILSGMTRLRQICCDPRLVNEGYSGESAKLERLFEYLKEAKLNGKRVVLFSQFTRMLSIIRERLDRESVEYHYLDGKTKKEDRLELTTRFNEGEKDLFLISLKAGGTGLNLTGGDTVILYDSWWNPAIEDQAADRVHRFGQKKNVQVLRLISKGTIEERINELQEQKRELIDSVIETNNEKNVSALTKNDILKLLEIEA